MYNLIDATKLTVLFAVLKHTKLWINWKITRVNRIEWFRKAEFIEQYTLFEEGAVLSTGFLLYSGREGRRYEFIFHVSVLVDRRRKCPSKTAYRINLFFAQSAYRAHAVRTRPDVAEMRAFWRTLASGSIRHRGDCWPHLLSGDGLVIVVAPSPWRTR